MNLQLMRRIKRLEERVESKTSAIESVFCICLFPVNCPPVPEPVEEWLTYKEAMLEGASGSNTYFLADPEKEWAARRRVTDGNEK